MAEIKINNILVTTDQWSDIKNKPIDSGTGDKSVVMGIGTIASNEAQMAIGQYNEEIDNALFIVGNGSATNDRNNAFYVDQDGKAHDGFGLLDTVSDGAWHTLTIEDINKEKTTITFWGTIRHDT